MRIIETDKLTPELIAKMGAEEKHWAYNGLDCCVTAEVFDALRPQIDPTVQAVYDFERDLQGPVMDMKLRGVLIDQRRRAEVVAEMEAKLSVLQHNLNRLVCDGIGYRTAPVNPAKPSATKGEFNWNSPLQMKELLYEVMRLPEQKSRGTVTADRDALEKLSNYFYAEPIINHVLALRDLGKKLGVLRTGIDDDGRIRTSYNIAGTDTGRFSSNASDFGTGTNLQNIEDSLRSIIVADPGYKFAYIDLAQAESRAVGAICWNLFGRGAYLDACESGDLHTTVTRLARKTLPWTGDLRLDKEIAESPGYRHLSYRDLSKKLGHGTNYYGKPRTMARHSKLPVNVIEEFQGDYFTAFPEIPMWHASVGRRLREDRMIVSLSGRRRHFFGRPDDDATLRAAIAYDPQGSVGDILNRGMLQVWRTGLCQLLMQIHDAILVQYPAHLEDRLIPQLISAIAVPVPLAQGRTMTIPSDCMTGWNFGKFKEGKNDDGLKSYKGTDTRRRTRTPETSRLAFYLD